MAQTDRQTDIRTIRGSWWGPCTSYNESHWEKLQNPPYPHWVKAVYGGFEECPTTKRRHYQFCVNTSQIRGSQLMDWLPKDHIQLARDKNDVKKYCMKADTAIGEKKVIENTRAYMEMHESLILIAQSLDGFVINRESKCWEADEYWHGVRKIVSEEPFRITQFSVPVMEKTWVRTREVWKKMARDISITPAPKAPSRFCPVCNERVSVCGCSSEEDIPDSVSEIFLADA